MSEIHPFPPYRLVEVRVMARTFAPSKTKQSGRAPSTLDVAPCWVSGQSNSYLKFDDGDSYLAQSRGAVTLLPPH